MLTTDACCVAVNGPRSAWLGSDGQVYIGHTGTVARHDGMPADARWESSLAHWDRYFDAVHAPAGWQRVEVPA